MTAEALNVCLPHHEIGEGLGALAAFVEAVEALGFEYLIGYDHVLGADPESHPDKDLFYASEHVFHEPLMLFSFLLAKTTTLRFSTGVVVLPQRQTALFAKQAANLDRYCAGRLRLGVGIGWNPVEYQALGVGFRHRGARLDEQIELLRALWAEPVVTQRGYFHHVDGAGINPRPLRSMIPIWIGGNSPAARHCAARIGDGWMLPNLAPGQGLDFDALPQAVAAYRTSAGMAGRRAEDVAVEVLVFLNAVGPGADHSVEERGDVLLERLGEVQDTDGVTRVAVDTQFAGLTSVDEHVALLGRVAEGWHPAPRD